MEGKTLVIDVGGTAIKSGLVSPAGRLLERRECDTNAARGADYLLGRICEVLAGYSDFCRVGMSVTGQIDSVSGTVRFATESVPGFTGMPLRALVQERFSVPVEVENDVNCAALGEAFYGAARDCADFLCLTYGTGVGGAIVIDRKIYHGSSFSAAEFGHFTTHADGLPCSCGQKGCYEAYASTRALCRREEEQTGKRRNGREIFADIKEGDSRLIALVDRWIDEIAIGLCSLVHIFNPACIVLGGGIMNEDYVLAQLRARLSERVMPNYRHVELRRAALGNDAGMMGAYHLFLTPGRLK